MRIITSKGQINTKKEAVVLAFEDDSEMHAFLATILNHPVRTSGMRVLPLIPPNAKIGTLQQMLIDIIEGIDGACGNDKAENKRIIDDTIGKLDKLLDNE
jgi:hypothetical protein